jgi:hypothetical protein
MVSTPVGMRCPDCASLRSSPLYQIHPARLALSAIAGLAIGVVGGLLLPDVYFFVFFVGPAYGALVAEVVLRAAGRKRGRSLEIIGVGSIILGALLVFIPRLLPLLRHPAAMNMDALGLLWPAVGFALAISTCYSRLKFW